MSTTPEQSRKIRVIHRESFGTSDRGDEWGWSFSATWWHQLRGVKGFHTRNFFGWWPKSEHPEPPTVDDLAAVYNEGSGYTWEVAS